MKVDIDLSLTVLNDWETCNHAPCFLFSVDLYDFSAKEWLIFLPFSFCVPIVSPNDQFSDPSYVGNLS